MRGMITDSDVAGTEKLAVTHARPYWLEKNLDIVQPEEFGAVEHTNLLAAGTCFLVKGWSRTLCALGILRCAQESSEFMEVGGGDGSNRKWSNRKCLPQGSAWYYQEVSWRAWNTCIIMGFFHHAWNTCHRTSLQGLFLASMWPRWMEMMPVLWVPTEAPWEFNIMFDGLVFLQFLRG